jgi:hypothetical protein
LPSAMSPLTVVERPFEPTNSPSLPKKAPIESGREHAEAGRPDRGWTSSALLGPNQDPIPCAWMSPRKDIPTLPELACGV